MTQLDPEKDFEQARVLVTGGAGFIGSHLVEDLVARGARVRVLDNFITGKRSNLAPWESEIELIEGDLRDPETCAAACEGVRDVFHQGALGSVPRSMKDPATSIAVNVAGTANLFAAARDAGVRRIVYASSSSVYGDRESLPKREGVEGRPLSPYALSKAMNEELAEVYGRCFSMQLVGLRYFNIYGPRQDPHGPYAAVIPKLFAAFLAGEAPTIHGDGEQSRDFTWVGDAVRANLYAATAPDSACARAYNIAPGTRTTVNELARMVREACGSSIEPLHGPPRPGDVKHSMADPSSAREHLGWEARTALDEGLRNTLPAYREALKA